MTKISFNLQTTKELAKKHLSLLIYGWPKIGKTSLLRTLKLDKDSDLLYIAVDPGALALRDREFFVPERPNNGWTKENLESLYLWVREQTIKGKFKWVVVDGLDDVGINVLNDMKSRTTNLMKAYGEMADWGDNWIRSMRDLPGASTLFITHIREKDEGDGNGSRFMPEMPGQKLTQSLDKYFDLIMCMRPVQTEEGVKRMLQTSVEADQRYLTGDRSGSLLPLEEPNLQVILDKIEANIPGSTRTVIDRRVKILFELKKVYDDGSKTEEIMKFLKTHRVKTPTYLTDERLDELAQQVGINI